MLAERAGSTKPPREPYGCFGRSLESGLAVQIAFQVLTIKVSKRSRGPSDVSDEE
jgi:hypothetical protein